MIETNLIEDLRLLSPPTRGGWLALGIGLAAAALLGVGWLRWRTRSPQPLSLSDPGPSPWDVALADLERLTPLLQPEHSRDYGIASTSILRRYVEARYQVQAPRLTTEEFLLVAGVSPLLPADDRSRLGRFLDLGDRFKFGRYTASGPELHQLHTTAVDFLLRSRPEPEPEPGKGCS